MSADWPSELASLEENVISCQNTGPWEQGRTGTPLASQARQGHLGS